MKNNLQSESYEKKHHSMSCHCCNGWMDGEKEANVILGMTTSTCPNKLFRLYPLTFACHDCKWGQLELILKFSSWAQAGQLREAPFRNVACIYGHCRTLFFSFLMDGMTLETRTFFQQWVYAFHHICTVLRSVKEHPFLLVFWHIDIDIFDVLSWKVHK